jgi:zinc D-Ala-D-Ala carboxypeptidase
MPANLSENFTLEELTHSEMALRRGFDNNPSPAAYENLIRLANLLEQVRKLLGKPLLINSGYRSKEVNDAVGSKDSSQHRIGCAADIRVPGMNPKEVCDAIIASDIQYDQLIREFWEEDKGGGWTHISVANTANLTPKGQTLIIDKKGTRPYA